MQHWKNTETQRKEQGQNKVLVPVIRKIKVTRSFDYTNILTGDVSRRSCLAERQLSRLRSVLSKVNNNNNNNKYLKYCNNNI